MVAYAALPSASKGEYGERITSLAQIGHFEIRLVDIPWSDANLPHMFWLELYDHAIASAVDSCRCSTIHEAVALFEELLGQAGAPTK